MTYGTLPSFADFESAFDRKVAQHSDYTISNDKHGRDGSYSSRDLWNLIKEQLDEYEGGGEEAGDFCSAVLSTLGFEWI